MERNPIRFIDGPKVKPFSSECNRISSASSTTATIHRLSTVRKEAEQKGISNKIYFAIFSANAIHCIGRNSTIINYYLRELTWAGLSARVLAHFHLFKSSNHIWLSREREINRHTTSHSLTRIVQRWPPANHCIRFENTSEWIIYLRIHNINCALFSAQQQFPCRHRLCLCVRRATNDT